MSKYVGACEDTYFPILLSDSTIFDKFTVIFYVLQKDQNSTEHIILQYQDNPFSKNQCQKWGTLHKMQWRLNNAKLEIEMHPNEV